MKYNQQQYNRITQKLRQSKGKETYTKETVYNFYFVMYMFSMGLIGFILAGLSVPLVSFVSVLLLISMSQVFYIKYIRSRYVLRESN